MNSSRPYLVRALYEWIVDNDCTPHILVNAEFAGVKVPPGYASDGQIVLNVSPSAVRHLHMDNEAVSFEGRFGGVAQSLYIPALDELVRPLEIVTKHTPLSRLLEQFRKGGAHFAVVEEADHKVVGFLTMEDVLEVLVGDIQDEHRKTERGILAYQPGKLLVRGDTPLFKLERLLGIDLDHVEADTLAGLVYDTLKRVPEEEEVLDTEGLRIIVKKMRGPKIVLAKVVKLD